MADHKKSIRDNHPRLLYIVVAFALAVLLWVYLNGGSNDLITKDIVNIPVKIKGETQLNEKGLVYLDGNEKHYVNIRLRGTEQNLKSIEQSTFDASVDVSEIMEAGNHTMKIVLQGMPNSLILEEMKPSSLTLSVDEITEKEMDVKVITNGKPTEGAFLRSVSTEQKVTVTGESKKLAQVDHVTGVVILNGLNAVSTQEITVRPYDKDGNMIEGIDIDPGTVWVDIVIDRKK